MIFDPVLDLFRGRTVTIPPMDGAFRPNTQLDDATELAALPAPDNLVAAKNRLLVASGDTVLDLHGGGSGQPVATFDAPVSAMALSPEGQLAVALETGRLLLDGIDQTLPDGVRCITALAYGPDGTLIIANGSETVGPSRWASDFLKKGSTGSLWVRDLRSEATRQIASGLAFPNGIHLDGETIVVSESWRCRLVRFERRSGRALGVVLDHLPGYPARLTPASDGGAWLAVFAPRNRLVEFVLTEDHYRADMLASVAPDYWIAPALASRRSFLEPLQCGAIKTMGVHKSWSPSLSYGLVAKLDRDMRPQLSLHSRADGVRHGVCSVVEQDGRLVVASKGGNCVVSVGLQPRGTG